MYEADALTTKDNYAKTQRVNYGQAEEPCWREERKNAWLGSFERLSTRRKKVAAPETAQDQALFADNTFAIAARRSSSRKGLLIM